MTDTSRDEETRNLAYELWMNAGQPVGLDNHFWSLAERRLVKVESSYPTLPEVRNAWPSEQTHGLLTLRAAMDRMFESALSLADIPPVNTKVALPEGNILWHYTSGDALLGIIKSHSIWATQLQCLNDNSEYRYPFSLLAEVLDLRPGRTEVFQENERSFLSYLGKRFREPPRFYGDCFVTCFSGRADDLSQWRAYGGPQGENGYAIGFDAHALANHAINCALQRVGYREQNLRIHMRYLIDALVNEYLENTVRTGHLEDYRSHWHDIIYTFFEQQAVRHFTAYKSSSFKSE